MYSIRNRISFSIIISMVVILLVMAFLLYFRVVEQVQNVFDQSIYDKAQALISLTELDEEGLEFDFAEDGVMPEYVDGPDLQYYQLWQTQQQELIRSPSLGDHSLPSDGVALGQHRLADLQLVDGRAGRLIEIGFMPRVEMEDDEDEPDDAYPRPVAQPITMVVARERESLDRTLGIVAWSIFALNALLIIVAVTLIWKLIGVGLAPLSRLAHQVGQIDESCLGVRIEHSGRPSKEIAPIERQLNHLLQRLQSAFEREKRFSSNVAHELRTPLSELRTLAEVGQMVDDDPQQIHAFFNDVGAVSAQMEKIVVTLLELTRSEAGLLCNDPEDIVLHTYCDSVWDQAINGSATDKLLVNEVPEDLVVHSDRDKLRIILSNLFTNAVCYSPDFARVGIRVSETGGRLALEVRNATTNLKPEDVLHMRDRFWRKDQAQDQGGHSGLGLTLVDALAHIMKMDIDFNLDEQGTLLVRISGLQPVAAAG
jgi:two-component system sensor histidine kinase QseC